MSYLPAQPMIDAVTRALQPSAGLSGRDLAVLAAWAVGGLLLSVRFFRWDPHRHGTRGPLGRKTRPVRHNPNSMNPGFHGVRTPWNPGFTAFLPVRRGRL
jgi:hypothetical protein